MYGTCATLCVASCIWSVASVLLCKRVPGLQCNIPMSHPSLFVVQWTKGSSSNLAQRCQSLLEESEKQTRWRICYNTRWKPQEEKTITQAQITCLVRQLAMAWLCQSWPIITPGARCARRKLFCRLWSCSPSPLPSPSVMVPVLSMHLTPLRATLQRQHRLEPRDDHWRPAVMLRLNPHVAGLDDVGLQSRFSQVAIKLLTWYNQSIQCAWPD